MEHICPRCKGVGTLDINVCGVGVGVAKIVNIKCVTCNGLKYVNSRQLAIYNYEQNMWCMCGNPSEGVDFYDDGVHPEIYKHHYRCSDCGKVTQIG